MFDTFKCINVFIWWRHGGSNPGPTACKAVALPTELYPHETIYILLTLQTKRMVTLAGLEPATPSLEDSYSIQLSYRANLLLCFEYIKDIKRSQQFWVVDFSF